MAKPTRGGQNSKMSKELRNALGGKRKQGNWSDEVVRAGTSVNPNYGKDGQKYTHNCQRCVIGYEQQRRGYDVEALPRQDKNDVMFENGRWMKMYEGQRWERNLGTRSSQVRKTIENKMAEWGVGARAIVYVAWKAGKAHVFNVEQTELGLMAVDAQTSTVNFNISAYLDRSKPSQTMISRVDGLKEKDDIKLAVKKKGKK